MKTVLSSLTSTCARLLLFTLACLAAAGAARAQNVITVTTLVDEDNGNPHPGLGTGTSLREAVAYANVDVDDTGFRPVSSLITFNATVFAAPRKTIVLNGQLAVTDSLETRISAPAAGVVISGGNVGRVFQVAAGARLNLERLTIANGSVPGGNGGGILNEGSLLVNACTLNNNSAATGGAIYSSTDLAGATLRLYNCTLSGNVAGLHGAAIFNNAGLTKIESCTISGNLAGATGSGVASAGTAATRTEVVNSIISGNGGAGATDVDFTGGAINSFVSGAFNLIGDGNATGAFTGGGDVTGNANPGLGALADNGGPTQTRALLAGSPALNSGGQLLLTIDQRAVSRLQYAPIDKGAFELQATIPLFESLTVTTAADEDNATSDARFGGGTSLREAIAYANRDGVNSSIVFDATVFAAPRKTITLGGVQLPRLGGDGTLAISAPAAGVEISGNNVSRVFHIGGGTPATLTGLTIRNGYDGGAGGGIFNDNALLTLEACTVRDCRAAYGGGIRTANGGSDYATTFRNCTISGNTATVLGGGIDVGVDHVVIQSCTITGNTAPNLPHRGGGVAIYAQIEYTGRFIDVQNSIIAGNTTPDVSVYVRQDPDFPPTKNPFRSLGDNLIGTGNIAIDAFQATGDVTGCLRPDLAPFAENGGPTPTRLPLATSPAINTGQTALTVDQRGVARPQPVGGQDDKGAIEYNIASDPALVVTTTLDVVNAGDGVISLREAVARANSDGVASLITFSATVFAAPRKRITLGGSTLTLVGDGRLTIRAPAAGVEISGGNASRVFMVVAGTDATLTDLTIRDGNASGAFGGAIQNSGSLELEACTLTANSAQYGGAISSGADLSLRNCTLTGNTAANTGGAVYNTGGRVVIESCTIAGNTAQPGFGSGVHTVAFAGARTEVRNSIISGNGGAAGSDVDFSGDPVNPYVSGGYNLVGDGDAIAVFNQQNDVTGNVDPGLLALAENGGPTPTRAPLAASPAVQTGSTVLNRDQRGVARPQRVRDDKGATELDALIDSLVVTTFVDEDDGLSDPRVGTGTSLREAIHWANADGVNSAITFDPVVFAAPRKRIVVAGSRLPSFAGDGTLSVTAPPAGVEVSGAGLWRVFQVGRDHSDPANVTMTGLTIRDGVAEILPETEDGDRNGGGIVVLAPLLLEGCTLVANYASVRGAAIYQESFHSLTLRNCTITGNQSPYGAGIYSLFGFGHVTLQNCTIVGNATGEPNAGIVHMSGNKLRINNSIIAGNASFSGRDVSGPAGTIESGGFNLIGESSPAGAFTAPGDQVIGSASPGVGALQENGGPTPTMALLLTSPALNAGNTSLTLDQRGVSRPRGSADDIGAYEHLPLDIAPPALAPGAVGQAYAASLTASGGIPPYTVAVIAGSLPPGLTLDGSGAISGTPLTAGTYDFTVRATGPFAAYGERAYSLLIGRVSAPLAEATAAWYRAEGNAQSFTGPAGTIGGTVGYAPGVVGQAFSFSGGAGYVALDPALFPMPTTGNSSTAPFSFETWFSTTSGGVILGQQTVAPYNSTTAHIPAIYVGADGRLRVQLFWNNAIAPLASAGAVNDGGFHHVAAVFDGTTRTAYLDGVAIGATAFTQQGYAAAYFYQLGTGLTTNWPSAPTGWFNFVGRIDETAIYRRALTAAEVQSIWGAGSKGKSTQPYFSAISRSGNNFHLTLKHWPSLRFQIEFSPTLLPAAYQDLGVSFTGEADGATDVTRTIPAPPPTGFLRAYEVP